MPIENFALELIEQIIGELDESQDKASLGSCALVCKDWRMISHAFMFKSITLDESWSEAYDLMRIEIGTQLLQEDAILRPLVRSVFMNVLDDLDTMLQRGFELLELLPRIQEVRLHNVDFTREWSISDDTIPIVIRSLHAFMPSIEHITLSMVTFSSFQDLENILRAAPNLHSFSLDYVEWPMEKQKQMFSTLPKHTPRLIDISHTSCTDSSAINKMLLSSSFRMALRKIVVQWDFDFEERYASELDLVNQNGETLEEVVLAVEGPYSKFLPSEPFLIIQGSRNRALTTSQSFFSCLPRCPTYGLL